MLEQLLLSLLIAAADAVDVDVFTRSGQQFLRNFDAVCTYFRAYAS